MIANDLPDELCRTPLPHSLTEEKHSTPLTLSPPIDEIHERQSNLGNQSFGKEIIRTIKHTSKIP